MQILLMLLSLFAANGNLIDRWAAALGGREKLATLQAVYTEVTIEAGGMTGTAKVWETADGKFREEAHLGPFSNVEVFDGKNGIVQQGNAPAHALSGAELQRAVDRAYAISNSIFLSDRRRATVSVESNDVIVKPEGGSETRVTLDPETALPKTITRRTGDRDSTMTILSYETVNGMTFEKEVRQSTGNAQFDVLVKVTKRVLNPQIDPSLFSLETKTPQSNVAWPAGKHDVTVPFELAQNHIYFPATINGKAANFVFDTGAESSVIDMTHAKTLGLPMKGKVEARGAGPGSVEASMVEKPTVEFGGISIPLQSMAAVPIRSISLLEGREMQGIAGYDVLSHFIVEIDYAKRELHFHEPASFTPSANAVAVPVTFDNNTPVVQTKVTTRDGRTLDVHMLIDTGARNAVMLNRPFIQKNDVARSIGPYIEGPLGMGVGGASTQKVGRLKSVEIAGFTVNDPITSFSTTTSGASANVDFDGLIGGEVLRRFTVTVDYPHGRLLLEPNGALGDVSEYDMSGMMLAAPDTKFDRILVRNVIAGSPAAAAGVKVNDELQSIDGVDVKTMKLDEVRKQFLQPDQTRALTLLRDGKPVQVTLTTKRQV